MVSFAGARGQKINQYSATVFRVDQISQQSSGEKKKSEKKRVTVLTTQVFVISMGHGRVLDPEAHPKHRARTNTGMLLD